MDGIPFLLLMLCFHIFHIAESSHGLLLRTGVAMHAACMPTETAWTWPSGEEEKGGASGQASRN